MTGGTRIIAIDQGADQSVPADDHAELAAPPPPAEVAGHDAWYDPPPGPAPRRWPAILAAAAATALVGGWSVLFALANPALLHGGSPAQWAGWVRDWSMPVLLVGMAWLLALRNSRREALRFAETARALGDESARLETRLITVNRELSLAREFIAAQSRDLEALGRIAAERLAENAGRLAELIHDNSARVETIGSVSQAALDNMEKLRGQLPVIASSAKDVTNNIGNAGRTARAQLEDMIAGFNKLNEFGTASERQVEALRGTVEQTIATFTAQAETLDGIAARQLAALTAQGEEFRAQLGLHEVEALAGIRNRAKALQDELEQAREAINAGEAESLLSLRARLGAVRDESAAIARSLRDGESAAIDAWREAVARLEQDLRTAIDEVERIDQRAVESARARLDGIIDEAAEVDRRMAQRDAVFADDLARRRAEIDAAQDAYRDQLAQQMAAFDETVAVRRDAQEAQSQRMVAQGEAVAQQLDRFIGTIRDIAVHGADAEQAIAAGLTRLTDQLAQSRAALAGTDTAVTALTDSSVRLLELIRASVDHSTRDLPEAMRLSETRLAELEARSGGLHDLLGQAEARGAAVAGHVAASRSELVTALAELDRLQTALGEHGEANAATLAGLGEQLAAVRSEAAAAAEHAQGELRAAITALGSSARDAVAGIEQLSAGAISALAARLGEESGEAIEKAMRARAAEAAGQLEQAAAHAAGVSREAAIQLRDQLAKVNELAGNLEQRVAQARGRAEEQVDNDFARRVALITESLNSNAIDIARALDRDVGDTAWAAYLRGERGVFTRRAVKLLDGPEAKAVAALYTGDRDFRDHVSRYIHDFEAMLRQLLSTRDGHALGVTLLSSDMGKLYVALAQAIERLRT